MNVDFNAILAQQFNAAAAAYRRRPHRPREMSSLQSHPPIYVFYCESCAIMGIEEITHSHSSYAPVCRGGSSFL